MKNKNVIEWIIIGLLLFTLLPSGNAQEMKIGGIDTLKMQEEISRFGFNQLQLSTPGQTRDLLYRYSIAAPQLHTYRVRPEATKLKNDYYPIFPVSTLPISYGEYNVGGIIRNFDKGAIIGSGSQENLISLGTLNEASIGYMHRFTPRLTGTVSLNAYKFSAPFNFNTSIGVSTNMRYKLTDRVFLNAFGSYENNLTMRMSMYNFGASAEVDVVDKFGLEAGYQTYYDNWSRRWQGMPIVKPYYKISDDCKIGIDFGPLIQEGIRNAVIKGRGNSGPNIIPPMRR